MACKIIIGILFLLFVDLIYCHHKMDKNRLIKSFQHLITTLLLPFKTHNCCIISSTIQIDIYVIMVFVNTAMASSTFIYLQELPFM